MKILFITQFLSTTKGGGEYLFSIMANELAKKGHRIWIITHKIEGENYKNLHKNITIHFASSIKYEGGLPPSIKENISFVFEAFRYGKKLIKIQKIDIIHSNNFTPALASSWISYFTKCPHVTALWDVFSLCGKNYWKKWAKQKNVSRVYAILGSRFEKMILSLRHDAIHTISNTSRNDLLEFGAKKPIHIISPTIENNKFTENKVNQLQFIYIGRLVFYKNVETIIRCIKTVKKQFPRIKLIIIGGGPQKQELESLVLELKLENNVIFKGFTTEKEKNDLLSSSAAMLFPSMCEGFGLVILEAFLSSKPVFVADKNPLPEIIENNIDGYVIEAKNENLWAQKIIEFMKKPELSKQMGEKGMKKAKNHYTVEKMIEGIEKMYCSIIK